MKAAFYEEQEGVENLIVIEMPLVTILHDTEFFVKAKNGNFITALEPYIQPEDVDIARTDN